MKTKLFTFLTAAVLSAGTPAARASIAYGSLNNFDTVNDTGHVCHGFEIEIEDCHSTDVSWTFDWNHYGTPRLINDDSVPGHPKCRIRWESKKNPDGTWAAHTAIPSGPINPTDGHQFTNPSVNFGGEHFGVGYQSAVGAVRYNWLIDDGAGNLVKGGAVQVSTPVFTYYPPVVNAVAQVQAVVAPPPPEAAEPLEFGKAIWVKEIRTTSHNNGEVKLRDLLSDDPENSNDKNWKNGEPDEVETEWQMLQKDYGQADGGPNNEVAAAPEDLPGGDEVVTRRYEFFKYIGPVDTETGEAMADVVGPDGIHGDGIKIINGVEVDLSTVEVVGEFTGSQMASVDVDASVGLIEHVSEGRVNEPYAGRTLVIAGSLPYACVLEGDLPPGMSFDDVTGILSGTPTGSGQFQFKVTASDFVNPDVEKNYTLIIVAAGADVPALSTVDTAAFPVGTGSTAGDGAFAPGSNVTVTATPLPGYRFLNWTDNDHVVSNANPYSFNVNINRSLVANFIVDLPQRTITTGAAPLAGGTTTGAGDYADGSSVTVTALTSPGYAFASWTEGAVVVSATPAYTFTAAANRSLTANFTALPAYSITTISSPVAGGLTSGGGVYFSGASVTVTATPNAGYVFARWVNGSGTQVSASSGYTFTVNGNRTLTAQFVPAGLQQTITTGASPVAGGITSGGGIYISGESITVVASPNANYKFSKWQENGATVSTSPSYTFTVAGSRSLVAKFTEAFVIITSSSPEIGGTTEMDSLTYKTGETAKAKAFPEPGWSFLSWTENGAVVSTSDTYSFNVTGNRTLRANFVSDTGVTVTLSTANAAMGSVAGEDAYAEGDLVIVSAFAEPGYTFLKWTEGANDVSYDADYFFLAVDNRALVAHFSPPVAIAVSAAPATGGNVEGADNYAIGTDALLVAAALPGYAFKGWTEGGVAVCDDAAYNFTVTAARSLVANFIALPKVTVTTPVPGSNFMTVRWPVGDGSWFLEESCDLVTWTTSTRAVNNNAGQNTVTVPIAGECLFFRLGHH